MATGSIGLRRRGDELNEMHAGIASNEKYY